MNPYLIFFIATAIVFLFTPLTIIGAKKLGLVTDKKKRFHPAHTHTGIIPRAGGVPIFLGILLTTLIFLPINKILFGVLLGSFLQVLIGTLDDYYDLSPYFRFGANLLISALVIGFGLGIPYISNPFGGVIDLSAWQIPVNIFGKHVVWFWADILAILWLTWTTNMVNWSKGVDGQLPGFVSITAFFMALLAQRFVIHDINVQTVFIFSLIISGAFLGFLPFNFYPQKIMPGYGGGALAGFLLGILSILSFGKIGTAILILAVPMLDAVYTIIRRIAHKKSPFRADWGHLHHRLLEIGWGKRRIAIFYWLVSFALGMISLFVKGTGKIIILVIVALLLLIFMFSVEKIKARKK